MNFPLAQKIYKMLDGVSIPNAASTLASVLIHVCLTNDITRDEALEAFGDQWDYYARKYEADKQERISRATPN